MVEQDDLVTLFGLTTKDLQYATTELLVPQFRNYDGEPSTSR